MYCRFVLYHVLRPLLHTVYYCVYNTAAVG